MVNGDYCKLYEGNVWDNPKPHVYTISRYDMDSHFIGSIEFICDGDYDKSNYENALLLQSTFNQLLKENQRLNEEILLLRNIQFLTKEDTEDDVMCEILKEAEDNNDEKCCEYPNVSLTYLIKKVIELKKLAISHEYYSRDKLYNRLDYLEHTLYRLCDVNVELERDWWQE